MLATRKDDVPEYGLWELTSCCESVDPESSLFEHRHRTSDRDRLLARTQGPSLG